MIRLAQLTRSAEWWDHKTPQVLSLAYATALLGNVSLYHLLYPGFLMIFVSLIVMAIYASIINDFTDLEIDLACGKSNMMQRLHPAVRWLLIAVSLGLVLLAAFFIYPNLYGVIFYLLIAVSISLYSFPPVRLKNKGILGVLACAAAEHLFPTLFASAVIFFYSGREINSIWLCAAGAISFMYGIRSILWHQFLDRENDEKTGMHTFGTSTDPNSFNRRSFLIIFIELIALAIVLLQLRLVLPVVFLLLYLLFMWIKQKWFKLKIILVVAPKDGYFQILMLDYYIIFFPLALLIYATFSQSLGWIVLLIHLLLFHKPLIAMLKEVVDLGRYFRHKQKD